MEVQLSIEVFDSFFLLKLEVQNPGKHKLIHFGRSPLVKLYKIYDRLMEERALRLGIMMNVGIYV